MIDRNALKSEVVKNGKNYSWLAAELGISHQTFYAKLKNERFTLAELNKMISILKIEDYCDIFFASQVSSGDTEVE